MHRYIKIPGLYVGATARAADLLPEDIAMGSIPGWVSLFDPDYANGEGAFDRARPPMLAAIDASPNNGMPIGAFSNGQKAFAPTDSAFLSWDPMVAFPTEEWTVFAVARPAARSGTSQMGIVFPKGTWPNNVVVPQVAFSADGTRFQVALSAAAGTDPDVNRRITIEKSFTTKTTLLMATFSVSKGLKLFENGELVANAPSDGRPISQNAGAGQWGFLRSARGLYGMMGVLNIDLGTSENEKNRQSIDAFLMGKYGILA